MAVTSMANSSIRDFKKFNSMTVRPGFSYARISATPTGSFADSGYNYDYWDFTGNGSLVIDEGGLLEVLVVGGGGGAGSDSNRIGAGGGGGVKHGIFDVVAGTVAVTVGAAGALGSYKGAGGSGSSFGSVLFAGGGGFGIGFNGVWRSVIQEGVPGSQGGVRTSGAAGNVTSGGGARGTQGGGSNAYDGLSLNFTGSSIEFGKGGYASSTKVASTGHGGDYASAGTDGRVIVRLRK